MHHPLTWSLFWIDHDGFDLNARTVSILGLFEDVATVELSHHDPSWCRPSGRRQWFESLLTQRTVPFVPNRVSVVGKEAVEFCATDVEAGLATEGFGDTRRKFRAQSKQEGQRFRQPPAVIEFRIGQAALIFTTLAMLILNHGEMHRAPAAADTACPPGFQDPVGVIFFSSGTASINT